MTTTPNTDPAPTPPEEKSIAEISMSQRFTKKVLSEFTVSSGDVTVNQHQRDLIQGYFIGIDQALKKAEVDRIAKNKRLSKPEYMNELAYTWANVDLELLSRSVMHYSKMGLDMMLPNQVSPIAYKNNATNKYVFTFIEGYQGKKVIAEKYPLNPFKSVTIELVREKDSFQVLKKSEDRPVDSYKFQIVDPFDRGEIVGGFGYIEYDDPTKNELIIMNKAEIMKRKPEKAAGEFWGGEKDEWKNGQKTGKTVKVEGWFDEMALKTVTRHVYGKIPLDSSKVSEFNKFLATQTEDIKDLEVAAEIEAKANTQNLDIEDAKYTTLDPDQTPATNPSVAEDPKPERQDDPGY